MGNQGGVYTWSQTAANNSVADNSVNWQEGQAPSSINDSARAMMASVAKYRDDISGSIVTTGTSTAYIVSSNQNFDTLADFNGKVIAFTPHATNGAGPVTVTVDGFANLPLRSAPNVELPSGVLVQGTPYFARFNMTDNALYLHAFYGNPYNIPIAAGFDYWAPTAPNSSFAFPFGQAISRTTYATLFGLVGTTYGAGDGSTTFNLPDKRGRVSVALDNMGGTAANRVTTAGSGINGGATGSVGGAQSETLSVTDLPPYTPAGNVTTSLNQTGQAAQEAGFNSTGSGGTAFAVANGANISFAPSSTFSGMPQGGTDAPFSLMNPAIVVPYIMRII